MFCVQYCLIDCVVMSNKMPDSGHATSVGRRRCGRDDGDTIPLVRKITQNHKNELSHAPHDY